jgi:uncharacterized protein (DUF433 family)
MSLAASPNPANVGQRASGELIPLDSPLSPYISVDPSRMHGEPCFKGTRIPVQILFDHLHFGEFEQFFKGFPDVTREQAVAVIDLAALGLLGGLRRL